MKNNQPASATVGNDGISPLKVSMVPNRNCTLSTKEKND